MDSLVSFPYVRNDAERTFRKAGWLSGGATNHEQRRTGTSHTGSERVTTAIRP